MPEVNGKGADNGIGAMMDGSYDPDWKKSNCCTLRQESPERQFFFFRVLIFPFPCEVGAGEIFSLLKSKRKSHNAGECVSRTR